MAKANTALGRLLVEWDLAHGPVDEETAAWAAAQFDRVDGLAGGPEALAPAARNCSTL